MVVTLWGTLLLGDQQRTGNLLDARLGDPVVRSDRLREGTPLGTKLGVVLDVRGAATLGPRVQLCRRRSRGLDDHRDADRRRRTDPARREQRPAPHLELRHTGEYAPKRSPTPEFWGLPRGTAGPRPRRVLRSTALQAEPTEDHREGAAAYKLVNVDQQLVPGNPRMGAIPMAEGTQLAGTLGDSGGSIELAGTSSDGIYDFHITTDLARSN
ncbi:MAG: hypothetical protein ACRDSR_16375 [Pseudonocardiaceae bacterium]